MFVLLLRKRLASHAATDLIVGSGSGHFVRIEALLKILGRGCNRPWARTPPTLQEDLYVISQVLEVKATDKTPR